jgi:hypothetical protein
MLPPIPFLANDIKKYTFKDKFDVYRITGDLNYECHFPSAGVLSIPDIHPVGVIIIRIPNKG